MPDELHVRAFPAQLEMSEGQLFGRIVPFNMPARVVDRLPDGRVDVYDEGFRAGVFARQMASAEPGVIRRVELVHTHDGGLGFLGPAVNLQDRDDGVHAEFKVLRSMRSDVEDLLAAGIDELSVEFKERAAGTVVENGVRWRTDAHLIRTALEAMGSYPGAAVLSYRDLDDIVAEQVEAEKAAQVEAERVAAEEAAAAAEEAARVAEEEAAEERRQAMAEVEDFLAAEQAKQADLVARFGG